MGNNALGVRTASETMRTLAFGAIGAGFTALGTPLTNTSRAIKFDNFTDQNLSISDDGINTKFQLAAESSFIFDEASNKSEVGGNYGYAAGTQFYVLHPGAAPTLGQVNLSTWYAQNL